MPHSFDVGLHRGMISGHVFSRREADCCHVGDRLRSFVQAEARFTDDEISTAKSGEESLESYSVSEDDDEQAGEEKAAAESEQVRADDEQAGEEKAAAESEQVRADEPQQSADVANNNAARFVDDETQVDMKEPSESQSRTDDDEQSRKELTGGGGGAEKEDTELEMTDKDEMRQEGLQQ